MIRKSIFLKMFVMSMVVVSLFGCASKNTIKNFTSDRILFLSDKGNTNQWYLMDPDGKNVEALNFPIPQGATLESLIWQSELKMFFLNLVSTDGKVDIFSYKLGDTKLTQISHDGGLKSNSVYSKDSNLITYVCFDYGMDICVMDLSGKNYKKLTSFITNETSPTFINGGKEILFVSAHSGIENIWKTDLNGEYLVNISNIGFMELNPRVSADGNQIVFESQRDSNWNIFTMNLDGTNVKDLTNNESSNRQPQWSSNDQKIAFLSDRDGSNNIFVMNNDGSDLKNLTQDFIGKIQSFIWSGDNQSIYFVGLAENNLQIYSVNIDNSVINQVTKDQANHTSMSWIGAN
ncbi:MAG: DPP IV N-terminal domain-containing protein [Candidatus Helarchaeota archaeon]|nr:DPP IV N-terminal domain-containing protein [Candidatus Helarchaeota archaeon]